MSSLYQDVVFQNIQMSNNILVSVNVYEIRSEKEKKQGDKDRRRSGEDRRNSGEDRRKAELDVHSKFGPPYPGPNPRNPNLPLDQTKIVA